MDISSYLYNLYYDITHVPYKRTLLATNYHDRTAITHLYRTYDKVIRVYLAACEYRDAIDSDLESSDLHEKLLQTIRENEA